MGREPLLVDGAERRVFLALFFAEQRRQAFQRFFFRAEAFFSGDYALFLISLDAIAFCYLGRPRVAIAVYASGSVAAFGVFSWCLRLLFAAPAAVRGSIGDSFAAFDTMEELKENLIQQVIEALKNATPEQIYAALERIRLTT